MAVDKKQLNSQGFSLRNSWLLTQTKTVVTILPTQTACTISFICYLFDPTRNGWHFITLGQIYKPRLRQILFQFLALRRFATTIQAWQKIIGRFFWPVNMERQGSTEWGKILRGHRYSMYHFTPKLPLNTSYIEYLGEGVLFLWVFVCVRARVNVINRIFRWWTGIVNFQSKPANSKNHDADSWPLQAKQRKKENPKSTWWF